MQVLHSGVSVKHWEERWDRERQPAGLEPYGSQPGAWVSVLESQHGGLRARAVKTGNRSDRGCSKGQEKEKLSAYIYLCLKQLQ